jgi:hypothetical protein
MALERARVEGWIGTAERGNAEIKAWIADTANARSPFLATIQQVAAGIDQGTAILAKIAATMERSELTTQRGALDTKIAALDVVLGP